MENRMRKGCNLFFCVFSVLFLFSAAAQGEAQAAMSITGAVRQPLNLTMSDLARFSAVRVRLNEVSSDKTYHGAFYVQGVPLAALLDLATIQKEGAEFSKPIDLAVVVRSRDGRQVVLSWGEVFYRNPAEVVIAVSGSPVIPHKSCGGCHSPDEYARYWDPLKRAVAYPKLVVAHDFYGDRSLEDVVNIEVVDLHAKPEGEGRGGKEGKPAELFSPRFTVGGVVKKTLEVSDLTGYPRVEIPAITIGDGRGFHGVRSFEGVPLIDLLKEAGVEPDVNTVVIASAPDGYQSLLSCGELFLSLSGRNIIMADRVAGEPLEKDGRFNLILPEDLAADRWVKAVSRLEVVSLKKGPARLTIIGVGCGDTSLLTLEAVSAMGRADVFVCTDDLRKRLARYMGDKPVLFDPLMNIEHVFDEKNPETPAGEKKKVFEAERAKNIRMIKDALAAGRNVGFLEYGDPTLYGSWIYGMREFKDVVDVIPGISAFNAANAAIGKHFACNGCIVLSTPKGIRENEAMVKTVAAKGDTLVLFMGLKDLKDLAPLLENHYPAATPVDIVYKAGYSGSQRLVRTTLREAGEITEKDPEKHLGMIYIGPCLAGEAQRR
jgi:precorrin-4 methylase/DMSO/TMAO reductase YedYZ molybdopterin-dependent catalytic subunit